MAAKIVRQPNKIALLGSPTSAAAMAAGREGAPAALRAAGLIDRLQSLGYQVTDLGDDPPQIYKPDEESPRARNVPGVLLALESLKPRVELAVKSAALPLILGGDSSVALATIAGVRRYFRHVGMIYMDGAAGLLTPATTSSGCVDGMVVSHITGRGAAELIRFWTEPPLVREPDLAVFGAARLEQAEEEVLRQSPLRRYLASDVKRMGPAAAAQTAVERIHGNGYQFILHLGVNVIADFQATDNPSTSGLRMEEVRESLEIFFAQKHLAAVEVTAYNPTKDPDGSGAKLIIDLLADVFAKRLGALQAGMATSEPVAAPAAVSGVPQAEPASAKTASEDGVPVTVSPTVPGEAWSSDSLDSESSEDETAGDNAASDDDPSEPSASAGESHS